ncbi:hypothetical protein CU669_10115 [Paramagnetospirillum kuznetsovii]|uniref:Uncharacterized protein n=1 Tax=Paramagnetospirillum kuznetsovii TaxID=2053833 RepID=A0A364NYG6_9PROT|nr:hypothetical protein [Paramagnetospirillum kuznetsovii]RAU22040.1 hypothetical protein CU669_10115 [Paramagnetospirillum kuznetsovii]
MIGWLQSLFLDKRAREALQGRAPLPPRPRLHVVTVPPRERDVHAALAEAEERMRRLPPEKAQLIRTAMAVRRASQSALAHLSDDEMDKLRSVAEKALLGGGR